MSAREIALSAHAQAVAAEEARIQAIADDRAREEERKLAKHRENFQAALRTLGKWFPGVFWSWEVGGDYGFDTLVFERDEPTFRLKVHTWMTKGYQNIEIQIGDYVLDRHSGYHYFSGVKVRSAADVGRYLMKKEENDTTR